MKDEAVTHLHDAIQAARAAKAFVAGHAFEQYAADELLRSAVERKFEIMGEALNRIRRDEPALLERIREYRDIVSLRNILVHGYDSIDDEVVWDVIREGLDNFIADLGAILNECPR
jgi:uncharacterized protein with HEPN domain